MSVEKMKQEARRKFRKYHKGESLHNSGKQKRKDFICRGGGFEVLQKELENHLKEDALTGGFSENIETCKDFATTPMVIREGGHEPPGAIFIFNEECFREENEEIDVQYDKEWLKDHPAIAFNVAWKEEEKYDLDQVASLAEHKEEEQEIFVEGKPTLKPCLEEVQILITPAYWARRNKEKLDEAIEKWKWSRGRGAVIDPMLDMAKEARKEIKKEHPDFFRKYGDLTNFFAFDDVSGKKIKLKEE